MVTAEDKARLRDLRELEQLGGLRLDPVVRWHLRFRDTGWATLNGHQLQITELGHEALEDHDE